MRGKDGKDGTRAGARAPRESIVNNPWWLEDFRREQRRYARRRTWVLALGLGLAMLGLRGWNPPLPQVPEARQMMGFLQASAVQP